MAALGTICDEPLLAGTASSPLSRRSEASVQRRRLKSGLHCTSLRVRAFRPEPTAVLRRERLVFQGPLSASIRNEPSRPAGSHVRPLIGRPIVIATVRTPLLWCRPKAARTRSLPSVAGRYAITHALPVCGRQAVGHEPETRLHEFAKASTFMGWEGSTTGRYTDARIFGIADCSVVHGTTNQTL